MVIVPGLRTTNSLERLHTEIKRRIRSAGAFPDRASALRLITAVASRRYLDLTPKACLASSTSTSMEQRAGSLATTE